MKWHFRITAELLTQIHKDLDRPHSFAAERVGFLSCRLARGDGDAILLAADYLAMDDGFYVPSDTMGAVVNANGIRAAMQMVLRERCSLVHIHRHEHHGKPGFSKVDLAENSKLIPSFWNVARNMPHGAIVLSLDRAYGCVWDCADHSVNPLTSIQRIGLPIKEMT
jgi:hypothetical protein